MYKTETVMRNLGGAVTLPTLGKVRGLLGHRVASEGEGSSPPWFGGSSGPGSDPHSGLLGVREVGKAWDKDVEPRERLKNKNKGHPFSLSTRLLFCSHLDY